MKVFVPPKAIRETRLATLKLGSPAMFGNHALVATEDPDAKTHGMWLLDVNALSKKTQGKPLIIAQAQPLEHIRQVKWIQPSMVLCAAGKGLLQRWALSTSASGQLECVDQKIDPIHTDYIRDLAVSPVSNTQVASGGFDQAIRIVDLTDKPQCAQTIAVSAPISSMRWKNACGVSCTQDDGKMMLFDIREHKAKHAIIVNTSKADLYAHEHYMDFNMLLGFADGELRHIDLRKPNLCLLSVSDPYVHSIGNIEYHPSADHYNSFVVSGLQDFSIWRHDTKTGDAHCWGHSTDQQTTSVFEEETRTTFAASYVNSSTVLATNSRGYLQLHIMQDFAL